MTKLNSHHNCSDVTRLLERGSYLHDLKRVINIDTTNNQRDLQLVLSLWMIPSLSCLRVSDKQRLSSV
ncbi:hypothetical protein GCM10008934_07500 [Virgibacillus salarius]